MEGVGAGVGAAGCDGFRRGCVGGMGMGGEMGFGWIGWLVLSWCGRKPCWC